MTISLPYPPANLSPNARLHWAAKARAVRVYRLIAWTNAYGYLADTSERPLPVQITFHPPDRRRRDRDNMIAAFKAGADGIADAIGVDDGEWSPTYLVGEPVKGGKVTVTIG